MQARLRTSRSQTVSPPEPSASRTATHRTTLALLLKGSTLNANIAYLNQGASSASQGSALSSVDVLFRFAFDAGTKQYLTNLTQPFRLAVNYSAVPMEHGGDYEERLTLFIGTGCSFNAAGEVTDCAAAAMRRTTASYMCRAISWDQAARSSGRTARCRRATTTSHLAGTEVGVP